MGARTTDRPGFLALVERAEAARRETALLMAENRRCREQAQSNVRRMREVGRSLRPTPAVIHYS